MENRPTELLSNWGLKILEGQGDGNDFYRHISEELYDGDKSHPKSARNEICKFQLDEKWMWYFQLFFPRNFTEEKDTKDLFREDVNLSGKNYEPPSERDIFAAATRICQEIFVLSEVENFEANQKWKWFHFKPVDKYESGSNFLMFLRLCENEKTNFYKLKFEVEDKNETCDDQNAQGVPPNYSANTEATTTEPCSAKHMSDFLTANNIPHINCHVCRFQRGFLNKIPKQNGKIHQRIPESDVWEQDADFYDTFSLFRCLSKDLYGTDRYYKQILQTALDYELLDENYNIFSGFTEVQNEASDKERKTVLKQKLSKIRDGSSNPNEAEIYAVATILKTSVFVCTDFDKGKWEMFPPLTCSATGDSFIALRKKGGMYYRLCQRSEECSCLLSPPVVMGHVGEIQQNIFSHIDQMLANEKTCCQLGHHKRHGHLKELVKSRFAEESYETRNPYLRPMVPEIENVVCSLKSQKRTLDQIQQGGDSLYHCISKEIYGTDNHFEAVREEMMHGAEIDESNLETLLQFAAEFLSRPIYVFQRVKRRHKFEQRRVDYNWSCYMPGKDYTIETTDKPTCRYYITIYYNHKLDKFDRIVPEVGCNCQCRPPETLIESRAGTSQTELLVEAPEPHNPMVEFFMDELKDDDFQMQSKNIVMPHPFYEAYHVLHRTDMSKRCIDQVTLDSNSFYRCLSKEIFGTDLNYAIIREKICLEMRECSDIIGHILCDRESAEVGFFKPLKSKTLFEKSHREKAFENRMEMIENDSEAEDVEILAAATFLQTPIFVLCLDDKWRTSWVKFEQLRRKPRPNEMPVRQSFCRKSNRADKYYVTLLRTSSGHYDRIVPKTEICNCLIEAPECPSPLQGKTLNITQIELHYLQIFRRVENCLSRIVVCLNDWDLANELMIQLCEVITNRLEERRQKVNIATIAGSVTGLVGGVLAIAGLALGPVTFGASFGLTIAGGVIGGVGGLTTTGSKVTEAVYLSQDINFLNVCRGKFETKVKVLQEEMISFKKRASKA